MSRSENLLAGFNHTTGPKKKIVNGEKRSSFEHCRKNNTKGKIPAHVY